jgi:serine/threonine protein kinase
MDDPLIGQQLGAYLIQSKLGEGGMARVYKAYHARLRREVAIKVILSQIAEKEGFKARFEREAQLIASLQHPNIVAVYDFGDTGNLTYLVMQYVGGGTLRDKLRGGRALDPRQAILYCQQMARALHHAHLRGIVHRDVKPQNMLISTSDSNQLLLSDFGIAKLFDSRQEPTLLDPNGSNLGSDPSLTNVDQIVGTAEYMSPEQINGKPVDARTDVYALGVVLFQTLTGEVPFHSTTVQGLLFQHVYTPPPPLREFNPYVPEILEQITTMAMAKAPQDRFPSAEVMAQALETANMYVTDRLSSSLPAHLTTPGQFTADPQTPSSQNRLTGTPPSYDGQQSSPASPGIAASPQQQSAYGTTPPYGSPTRVTNPSGANMVAPTLPRTRSRAPLSYIAIAAVLLVAIGLILVKQGIIPWFSSNQGNPSTTSTSFTETFQDNHLNWTIGSVNGLTAQVRPNSYTLDISQSTTPNTYFPYPSSSGSLPDNFTWTVQISRTKGDAGVFYGLAFRLKQDGNNVSCYAFVIDGNGDYQVLKYAPGSPSHSTLGQGQMKAIHTGLNQLNTLQAIIKGNRFFLTINSTAVDGQSNLITDNSGTAPYTGGQPALAVAGSRVSDVSFTVTSARLTIP